MPMLRKALPVQIKALADDEVEVIISTPELARDGHVLEPMGCQYENYLKNPVVLWMHDDTRKPVGRTETLNVTPDGIRALCKFPQPGISKDADEIRGLAKTGFIHSVSVGFNPIKATPLDPRKPGGGMRITEWELLEWSWVTIPADTGAVVAARSQQENDDMAEWKVGAARNLPIEDSDSWDAGEAEKAIFEHAGGDEFKPEVARKAFLLYDADAPEKRESYKCPIATVKDGKLVVPKGAIRAAASRLPQVKDVPDDVKERAEAVLKAYKKKAKIGDDEDGERAARQAFRRMFGPAVSQKRDLYSVASLCWMMMGMENHVAAAKVEAALEGDESKVPAMLTSVLHDLGEALCAMAEEEVEELLAGHEMDDDDLEDAEEELGADERAFVRAAKSPLARAFRYAIVQIRAGKVLSKSNADELEEADDHHGRAMKHHRALGEHHEAVSDHADDLRALHDKMDGALETAAGDGEDADRALEQCRSLHGEMGRCMDDMKDRHEDVGDAHRAMGRSVKGAQRCVRAVLGRSVEGEESDDGNQDDKEERTRRLRALALRGKVRAAEAEAA